MKLACEDYIIGIMKIFACHGFIKISFKILNYNQFMHNKINHEEKIKIQQEPIRNYKSLNLGKS